jgi:hypothetical protein
MRGSVASRKKLMLIGAWKMVLIGAALTIPFVALAVATGVEIDPVVIAIRAAEVMSHLDGWTKVAVWIIAATLTILLALEIADRHRRRDDR